MVCLGGVTVGRASRGCAVGLVDPFVLGVTLGGRLDVTAGVGIDCACSVLGFTDGSVGTGASWTDSVGDSDKRTLVQSDTELVSNQKCSSAETTRAATIKRAELCEG